MPGSPPKTALAWPLFDAIIRDSQLRNSNPWNSERVFEPDYDVLARLLSVPLLLSATSQSGVPAIAIDVWVAYELRRSGLEPDSLWPREAPPRVVDADVLSFIAAQPQAKQRELTERLRRSSTSGGVAQSSASILGKNYLKQVDVVMSSWQTGPEVLISTKRMDSSFGKNAANRVEESYGDAKNLALRHPLAALGFMYSLRSSAYRLEKAKFDWIVDLLMKLQNEEDAYDACSLIVPEWTTLIDTVPQEADEESDDELSIPEFSDEEISEKLNSAPAVTLRHDLVPKELNPGRFFDIIVRRVLSNSPIDFHVEARNRLTGPSHVPDLGYTLPRE